MHLQEVSSQICTAATDALHAMWWSHSLCAAHNTAQAAPLIVGTFKAWHPVQLGTSLGHLVKYCTSQQSHKTYPKDIRFFWDDSSIPTVITGLKLLLHQYDIAWVMQPTTHGLLQHKQGKHVSIEI